jgi:Phosphotransferase enzyme family
MSNMHSESARQGVGLIPELRVISELAAEHGLRFDRPVVLRDRSNLLVRLEPLPVVARVPAVTGLVRRSNDWLAREVAVAGYLASVGAPVVAPSSLVSPGPHGRDGVAVTFFEFVESVDSPLDAREAGRRLRECHEALAGFEGSLPRFGLLDEAERMVGRPFELRSSLEGLELPLQAVHGDAHLGNVINTADGPLWNDWEDTMLAPREWDLGCLHAGSGDAAAAQAGYGAAPEPHVLEAFVAARRWQVEAWRRLY